MPRELSAWHHSAIFRAAPAQQNWQLRPAGGSLSPAAWRLGRQQGGKSRWFKLLIVCLLSAQISLLRLEVIVT